MHFTNATRTKWPNNKHTHTCTRCKHIWFNVSSEQALVFSPIFFFCSPIQPVVLVPLSSFDIFSTRFVIRDKMLCRLHLEQHYNGIKVSEWKTWANTHSQYNIWNWCWWCYCCYSYSCTYGAYKSSKRSEQHFEKLHAMKKISQELRFKKFVFLWYFCIGDPIRRVSLAYCLFWNALSLFLSFRVCPFSFVITYHFSLSFVRAQRHSCLLFSVCFVKCVVSKNF